MNGIRGLRPALAHWGAPVALGLVFASSLFGQGLLDWGWRAELARPDAWQAERSWQADPSPGATCVRDGDALRFVVPEAALGMKWSHAFPATTYDGCPYLVLRYRAEGLLTDSDTYLVYLDDRGSRETSPVRLSDAVPDGQWHTVAVDLRRVAEGERFAKVAVQVRSGTGPATLWVADLRLAERAPESATVLGAPVPSVPPPPAWEADLAASPWEARPSWLPNPDPDAGATRTGEGWRLGLAAAGKGMKWSWFLTEEVPLAGHAFLCLRYRATGTAPTGDYAACVLGKPSVEGKDYVPVISPVQLRHDGRWHTLCVPLGELPRQIPRATGFAVQAQAAREGAALELARLALAAAPAPIPAAEYMGAEPGTLDEPLTALPLSGVGRLPVAELLRAEGLAAWPDRATVEVGGVPFVLPAAAEAVPATGISERGTLRIPVHRSASEVYLLVLGVFRGAEEDVYSTAGRLTSIPDIDRFAITVSYTDGGEETCFPANLSAGRAFRVDQGGQALRVVTDPERPIRELVLHDNSPGAAFVVPAATANAGAPRASDPDEALPDFSRVTDRRLPATEAAVRVLLGLAPADSWLRLWTVRVDGLVIAPERFQPQSVDALTSTYLCAEPALRLTLRHHAEGDEFGLEAEVENRGTAPLEIAVSGPALGPLRLGDGDPARQWYWFPCVGNRLSAEPFLQRARYGGRFPLQVMSVFDPVADRGAYLRTLDLAGNMRDYVMQKGATGVALWVDTCGRQIAPGAALATVSARLGLTGGDWRTAFRVYRDWVRTWYRPVAPRQAWFRDVFNFRQRFLHGHDPLYDARQGTYDLPAALAEGSAQFGGIEYLHLFDWGSVPGVGRVYGRSGDVSPFDGHLKGGADAFQQAIAAIQQKGVRVGLYIEGYLLEEKGRLGAPGRDWQIRRRDGERFYWPRSSEMMICSHVPAWRDVQASTYANRVRELGVDGMYLDQFGFANPEKDCWCGDHGHPVPGDTVLGERGLSRLVRQSVDAVRPGVVLYDEEVPCDVNSQIIDGSFSYHMKQCRWNRPLAPLHPLRFAIPSFKTFEILVCDHPMGSWAEGVKWTFFNGEGIWLEGPASTWFAPETLATIRRCHAILHEHRAAFSSDEPMPLEPTLTPGVFANVFPAAGEVVKTLYNARHRSVMALVAVPAGMSATAVGIEDAWNRTPVTVRNDGGRALVAVGLGPRDVGCLVFRRATR